MSKPPIITSDRAVYLFFEFTMATISIATEIIIINSSYVLISRPPLIRFVKGV